MSPAVPPGTRPRHTLTRTYAATIEEVWALWTTPAGVEAWWGPTGFAVTVRTLDLRPGGELRYVMTAVEPDKIAFMERAGMPVATECTLHFTVVSAPRLLAYVHLVDFVPGVASYDVTTIVELAEVEGGVQLTLHLEAMHEELWTERARLGWADELGRLAAALARRTA
jgi:uncharacterized protein YndB with AHSA1/START domain